MLRVLTRRLERWRRKEGQLRQRVRLATLLFNLSRFFVHGNDVSTSLTQKASTSCYTSLFRGEYTSPAGLINLLCLLKAYHTRHLTLLIKTKTVGVTTSTSIHDVPELHFNVPQILSTVARCSFWHNVQINIWCMRLH